MRSPGILFPLWELLVELKCRVHTDAAGLHLRLLHRKRRVAPSLRSRLSVCDQHLLYLYLCFFMRGPFPSGDTESERTERKRVEETQTEKYPEHGHCIIADHSYYVSDRVMLNPPIMLDPGPVKNCIADIHETLLSQNLRKECLVLIST